MNYYASDIKAVVSFFNSDTDRGIKAKTVLKNREKFGENVIVKSKSVSLLNKIFSALSEPMMLILIFQLRFQKLKANR